MNGRKILGPPVPRDLCVGHESLGVALVGGAGAAVEFRQVDEPATVTEELEAVGVGTSRKQLLVDVASVGCDAGASSRGPHQQDVGGGLQVLGCQQGLDGRCSCTLAPELP